MKKLIILALLIFASACCPKIPVRIFDGTERYYGIIQQIDYIQWTIPVSHPHESMLIHADSGMFRLSQYDCDINPGNEVWIHEIPAVNFDFKNRPNSTNPKMFPACAVINGYKYPIK